MNQKISITLPQSNRYLKLCEQLMREVALTSGFSDSATEMLVTSLLEAVEELIRVAEMHDFQESFELSFEADESSITVALNYNGKIPLNPHQLKNYQVPTLVENINSDDLEGLWLHLIKARMDRLFFEVKNNTHLLKMVKYHREKGDERKNWVLNIIPRLKESAVIEYARAATGKIEHALIRDVHRGVILRLGEQEAWLLEQMDGKLSFDDIYMKYISENGLLSPGRITFLYEKLESTGMLEDSKKKTEELSGIKKIWQTFANPIIVVPDTEKIINQLYTKVNKIINPAGFFLFFIIGLSGLYPLYAAHFEHFTLFVSQLEQFFIYNPSALLITYILTMVMMLTHELGHGLICRHYGGHVNRMGVMFYLVSFLFFCDTSSAWNFKQKYQRILVSLGGPLTTFVFSGTSLWLAYYNRFDPYWGAVWLAFAFICFTTLAMNLNPFIKMDAYYILIDLLELPRLRELSFQFLWERFSNKWRKNHSIQQPNQTTAREETIFWFYGITGLLMSLVFMLLPICYYGWLIIKGSTSFGVYIITLMVLFLILAQLSFRTFTWYRTQRYQKVKLE